MDIETLILILFFFVFPIVRQILESRKKPDALPPESDAEAEYPEQSVRRVPAPTPVDSGSERSVSGEEDWAASWGRWPGSEVTETPEEEEFVRDEPEKAGVPVAIAGRSREPVPIEVRDGRTIVLRDRAPRPGTLDMDRVAEVEERRRNRARGMSIPVAEPARVPALRIGPAPVITQPTATVEPRVTGVERPSLTWLGGGSSERLREMLIASEILGPPKAEREFD